MLAWSHECVKHCSFKLMKYLDGNICSQVVISAHWQAETTALGIVQEFVTQYYHRASLYHFSPSAIFATGWQTIGVSLHEPSTADHRIARDYLKCMCDHKVALHFSSSSSSSVAHASSSPWFVGDHFCEVLDTWKFVSEKVLNHLEAALPLVFESFTW